MNVQILPRLGLILLLATGIHAQESQQEPSTPKPDTSKTDTLNPAVVTPEPVARQWSLAPRSVSVNGQGRYDPTGQIGSADFRFQMTWWVVPKTGYIPMHVAETKIVDIQDQYEQALPAKPMSKGEWKEDLHDWHVVMPEDDSTHDMTYRLHMGAMLPHQGTEELSLVSMEATVLAGALPAEIITISPIEDYLDKPIGVENIPGMTLRVTREPAKPDLQMYHVSVDFEHRLHVFQVRFLDEQGKNLDYPHYPYHRPGSLSMQGKIIKRFFRLPPTGCKTLQIHVFPKLEEVKVSGQVRNVRLQPYDPLMDKPAVNVELTPAGSKND